MDYVDWVERVMSAIARAWKTADGNTKLIGLQTPAIYSALGQSGLVSQADYERTKFAEATRNALRDLESMGLIEQDFRLIKVTSEGNKFPIATLSSAWPQIMKIYIDEEQESFLKAIADIGQEKYDDYACVRDLSGNQVFAHLGWISHSVG
jgi:hypothetical protein